jgi:fibronectin type 3 domain-containing protein
MLSRSPSVILLAALVATASAAASSGGVGAPGAGPPSGPPPALETAIAAQERHTDELLARPGVVGTGVGLNPAGRPVIRIYVEAPAAAAGLPGALDGVPVETVATGIISARAPTDWFPRPVPIGVSSGHPDITAGTLGARVSDAANVYALSNNHVYANINNASIGDGIIQPGTLDGGSDPTDRIGTLADFQTIRFDGSDNTIDAAIALTSPANVGTATPADGYGTPSPTTTTAYIGQAVKKYGRTTGLTNGTVAEINVTVDVCYVFLIICFQEAHFVDQVSITPEAFSAGGDSGSLIVTQGGNQPVALLFAGGEGRTVGNPIDLVLQRFGVTVDGTAPPATVPSEPANVTASANDASVHLTWQQPASDGGSPVTGYRIYRGTAPGPDTLLASVGAVTSFDDTGLTNGVTYYYRVSAENEVGEGPLSSDASATPTSPDTPVEPLPTVDDFNRPDESPLSDSGRWSNSILSTNELGFNVTSNQLACSKTTTCTAWRNVTQYGPDTEAWATIATLPGAGNAVRLYARVQSPGTSGADGYVLFFSQASGTDQVALYRLDNGVLTSLLTIAQELAAGDRLLLRVKGPTLEAWRHDGTAWTRLGTIVDTTYAGAGFVGVGLRGTTGRLDDFGARGLSVNAPGAPTGLSAYAGDASVALTWQAPSFDGGSPVTGYRVYRGTAPGSESFLTSVGNVTSFDDTGLTNGETYYYEVSAVNAVGEGPLSAEASATPVALVVPDEPLPTIDDFDRPNESPLSDSGRWSNSILSTNELGFNVTSNQLACSKTTTCTAWRNDASYGPDSESWARIATLPGNGNAVRLYVRVQSPGTSGADGYVLFFSQASGTDQVSLYRLTNGALTVLQAVPQEIAAGDTLLLRAHGSTLESWRRSGSTWTRLGTVSDSTYAGAGYAGVGLRGTTGRLDDFGARTLGAAPPDTEPPSAPSALAASAAGPDRIDLSWQPASDNVAVALYRIERCQGAGCSGFAEIASTTATGYSDTGLSPASDYSYRVRAEDAAGNLGPYSSVASAATSDLVPPTEPLPTIDDFNRPNETLSDGGRWSNSVLSTNELGLRVTSSQLACSKTTTCTAWRNDASYGPDSESWARIATLPGNGNAVRLYVRLQSPGTSGVDGYMLLFSQASGTDQVSLYRLTDGVLTVLQTISQEIAAGDTLLLRARGSILESWRRSGSTWTRLGAVSDSTYAGAGYAGVGLRGKKGRLDDFGARSLV